MQTNCSSNRAEPSATQTQRQVKIGHVYRHFKGYLAVPVMLATHSETGEELVIYTCTNPYSRSLSIYARPKEMFLSPVDKNKYPNATQTWRFEE